MSSFVPWSSSISRCAIGDSHRIMIGQNQYILHLRTLRDLQMPSLVACSDESYCESLKWCRTSLSRTNPHHEDEAAVKVRYAENDRQCWLLMVWKLNFRVATVRTRRGTNFRDEVLVSATSGEGSGLLSLSDSREWNCFGLCANGSSKYLKQCLVLIY